MAAIAKLITFDGGIAFSDTVLKYQKRSGEGRFFPLDQIAAMNVRRPAPDADGFLSFQTVEGKRYRLFFEEDQLEDALQFKQQFLSLAPAPEDAEPSEPAPDPEEEQRPVRRRERRGRADRPEKPERAPLSRKWLIIGIAAAVVVVAAVVVTVLLLNKKSGGEISAPPAAKVLSMHDLTGEWVQTGGNAEGTYQFATVHDNIIEIFWQMDDTQTTALYWSGTYDAPTSDDEPYSWTSVNNTENTASSPMGSADTEKVFTYQNGQISYEVSALGVTQTVTLERR